MTMEHQDVFVLYGSHKRSNIQQLQILKHKQLAIKMNQAQKQVSIKQGYHQGQPMLGKQNQIHQALVINQG